MPLYRLLRKRLELLWELELFACEFELLREEDIDADDDDDDDEDDEEEEDDEEDEEEEEEEEEEGKSEEEDDDCPSGFIGATGPNGIAHALIDNSSVKSVSR